MDMHSKAAIQVVISQCLDYIYALTNSTELDRGPFESFQDDFTRSVLPKNIDYFYELAYLGALLRDLDRANYDIDKTDLFPFVGIGDDIIKETRYDESSERLYINAFQCFENISPELYNFSCRDTYGEMKFPIQEILKPFVNSEINCHTITYVQQELVKRRNMLGYILRIDDILLEAMES